MSGLDHEFCSVTQQLADMGCLLHVGSYGNKFRDRETKLLELFLAQHLVIHQRKKSPSV